MPQLEVQAAGNHYRLDFEVDWNPSGPTGELLLEFSHRRYLVTKTPIGLNLKIAVELDGHPRRRYRRMRVVGSLNTDCTLLKDPRVVVKRPLPSNFCLRE